MNDVSGAASAGPGATRARPSIPLPDHAAPLYTVGQVAELLGVQAAFLRRLDSEQVVSPARSSGGQRRYTWREIQHIGAVSALMSDGMTLAGARRIIELEYEVADLRRQLAEALEASRDRG